MTFSLDKTKWLRYSRYTKRKEQIQMFKGPIFSNDHKMKLRFIGANASMGLNYGEVYEAEVNTIGSYIYVEWHITGKWNNSCPYSSLKALCANWEDA